MAPAPQCAVGGRLEADHERQLPGAGERTGELADPDRSLGPATQGGARSSELDVQATTDAPRRDDDRAANSTAALPARQSQRFDSRAFRWPLRRRRRLSGLRRGRRFAGGDGDRSPHFFRVDGADEGVGPSLREGAGSAPRGTRAVDRDAAAARFLGSSRPVDPVGHEVARIAEGDGPAGRGAHGRRAPGEAVRRFGWFDSRFLGHADGGKLKGGEGHEREQEQPPAMPSPSLSTPSRSHPPCDTAPALPRFKRPASPAQ